MLLMSIPKGLSTPSLPKRAFRVSHQGIAHPTVLHGIGTIFATYLVLLHPLPPVAL